MFTGSKTTIKFRALKTKALKVEVWKLKHLVTFYVKILKTL